MRDGRGGVVLKDDRDGSPKSGNRRGSSSCGNAAGAVTAEFAVVLPAVVALLAMLLAAAAAGVTQLRLEEGARGGARALSRGEDPASVERTVKTLAGGSASATVAADGEWLRITVTGRVGGPLGSSIPLTLTASATTRSETAAASGSAPAKKIAPASESRGAANGMGNS